MSNISEYYFNQLSGSERDVYTRILYAVRGAVPRVALGSVSPRRAGELFESVLLDHPEILHCPGMFSSVTVSGDRTEMSIEYATIDQEAYSAALNAMLDDISRTVTSRDSNRTVCKKIYDYLATHIEYDYDVLNAYFDLNYRWGQRRQTESFGGSDFETFLRERSTAFTPYGVVINKKGVCMGIAKLFNIICDMFSIPCVCAAVRAKQPGGGEIEHMMNVVEVEEGKPLYVDVTFGLSDESLRMIKYPCFLEPNRIAEQYYTFKTHFDCNAEDLGYFAVKGTRFTKIYSLREYLESFSFSGERGEVRFRYEGGVLCDSELETMFNDAVGANTADNMTAFCSVDRGTVHGLIESETEE